MVVVVDDEARDRKALGHALEQRGVPTVLCEHSDAALAELEAGGVTVIVADERMSGLMSGTQLLRKARELYPEVTRVLWSAYVDSALIEYAPDCLVIDKLGVETNGFLVNTVVQLHRGAL